MFGVIRNIVLIFLILTIAYAVLVVLNRWKERRRLIAEYEALPNFDKMAEDRETYVERGMNKYNRSLRPKLILGVYVIPGAIAGLLVWLAQYG